MIWAQTKRKLASHNVGSQDIKELTKNVFNSITSEDWKNCCEYLKKIENEYYEYGRTLYSDIDELSSRLARTAVMMNLIRKAMSHRNQHWIAQTCVRVHPKN